MNSPPKLQIVNEEIDESVLWLEIADAVLPNRDADVNRVLREGVELKSIFATARKTTRDRKTKGRTKKKSFPQGPDADM